MGVLYCATIGVMGVLYCGRSQDIRVPYHSWPVDKSCFALASA